jgi:hypothetical protein
MLGLLDASKETFKNILSGGSGRAVAVVVGGAAESLKSEPGKMDLVCVYVCVCLCMHVGTWHMYMYVYVCVCT